MICINFSLTAILQVISISANMIAMWGKEAQLYLAINQEGKVYATVSLILFIGNSNIIFRNLLFISSYYFCCFLFLNNLLPFNKNFTIITTKWNEILKVSLSNHIFRKRKVVIVFWWNGLHQIFLTRMKVFILLTKIHQLIIFSLYQILENLWKLQILLLLIFTGMYRHPRSVHLFQNIKENINNIFISNNTRPTLKTMEQSDIK